MKNRKIVVYMTYGGESSVFARCALNWAAYACHFPGIDFIIFRDQPVKSVNLESMRLVEESGNFLILRPEIPVESNYTNDITWTAMEMAILNEKHKLIWNFLLERYVDSKTHFYHINNTSFVCFRVLRELATLLASSNLYGGRPIYHASRKFFYISGSHVFFSRDTLTALREAANVADRSSRAGDYLWGEYLTNVPRTIIPEANIVCDELDERSRNFKGLHGLLKRSMSEGHFQFRFKNNFIHDLRREDVDPTLQFLAMAHSLVKNQDDVRMSLDLVSRFQKPEVYLKNLIVVD